MPASGGVSTAEAKKRVLKYISQGLTASAAMAKVDRTEKTYYNWRGNDSDFAKEVDQIRAQRKRAKTGGVDPELANLTFAEWRLRFLGMETYAHQQQWIDVLEGREPTFLHENVIYTKGRLDRVLINTPPNHAKSTTITMQYVTYKLCTNPEFLVILVSKTQDQAKKYLYSIRQYLTSSTYAELQAAYAPPEGFKGTEGSWSQNKIYLGNRENADKDPSVEALGIGGQIYGARADLIILDDAITLGNANEFEKQFTWINQEVATRLASGKLLVVGTRVAATDLYSFLLNGDNYISGESPWTYLGQPAVLEYGETAEDWVTLWPRSNFRYDHVEDEIEPGLYRAQDGPRLYGTRESVAPSTWARIFMQQDVAEDATFHPTNLWGSVDKRRKPGPLRPGEWGGRRAGMEGMHVIGSIDPAGTGQAFALIYAVDRQTNERWLLDAWMHSGESNMTLYGDLIERWSIEYGVDEWVIEQNAYASWLIHDRRIVDFCRNRGIRITEHYTGRNKQDADFGVATIAPLFGTWRRHTEGGRPVHNDDNLIHIPDPGDRPAIKALLEQLGTWRPGKLGRQLRQDGPMALWFAELRARHLLVGAGVTAQSHMKIGYLSRGQIARQAVVPSHSFQVVAGHEEYERGASGF